MKTQTKWSYPQYRPAVHGDDGIYICQTVPAKERLTLKWIAEEERVFLHWRARGSDAMWAHMEVHGSEATLTGLADGTEYEFFVEGAMKRSTVGFAKTGFVPGTVVNYLHPEDPKYSFSGQYLCTPCILKHPNGYLLVSMDIFGRRAPQNLTLIFRSDDNGESWYHYSELMPCFWGTLFMHRGDVYMLATSTEYGDLLIGRSSDGGKTFSTPTVLFRGSCHYAVSGWHKSSMPVVEHKGRLWCGVDFGAHLAGGHASCLLSADASADLLDPDAWCVSEPLMYDPAWQGAVKGDTRGFLEGNAVVLPDGGIGNVLRYSTDRGEPRYGLIPILRGDHSDPEKQLTFDRFVPFQGNLSKFDVRKDPVSGHYFAIICRITTPETPGARNVLSLVTSADLAHWELACDLLNYADADPQTTGFQYVSFLFDGEDILYVSRTAFNGAKSFHDNNYVTFHRVKDFRQLIK